MTTHSRTLRAVALFLCCQPVFWMNGVALAQTLQRPPAPAADPFAPPEGAEAPFPSPSASPQGQAGEPDPIRVERRPSAALAPAAVAVDEPVDPDRYVCGQGDVFELNFWGLQNARLRVPIRPGLRSLNVAMAAAMVAGEALRQTGGFPP